MNDLRELRLEAIRNLIAGQTIGNQAEIVEALTTSGFEVTQSSVSRDLADLGVEKQKGRYVFGVAKELHVLGVISAVPAGPHLMVLKTAIGAAQAVAYRLDALSISDIVGTVAGDDTIFVATASEMGQKALVGALELAQ